MSCFKFVKGVTIQLRFFGFRQIFIGHDKRQVSLKSGCGRYMRIRRQSRFLDLFLFPAFHVFPMFKWYHSHFTTIHIFFYFLIISPRTDPIIGATNGFNNNPNKAPPFWLIIFFFVTSGTCLELSKRICCFLAHN